MGVYTSTRSMKVKQTHAQKICNPRSNIRNSSFFFSLRWVLYEKPNFKGDKVALDEGDIELPNPFSPPEEQLQNGHGEEKEQNGESSDAQTDTKPPKRFSIGSIRRAVRVRRAQM